LHAAECSFALNFLKNQHKDFSFEEIQEAFEFYAGMKLEFQESHFQSFTNDFISKVLFSYKRYRNKALAKYHREKEKMEEQKEPTPEELEAIEQDFLNNCLYKPYEKALKNGSDLVFEDKTAASIMLKMLKKRKISITNELVMQKAQKNTVLYDKTGEQHYDIISAFIKSIRGSDPNAAVYWLARMIEGGEDIKFIARRMVILSSEDIGMANPNALLLATSTFQAVNTIGYPEARIILSQCAVYLATSPKSNASYKAIGEAQQVVRQTGDLSVPLSIRNAPTKLMKQLGYGKEYEYAHNYEGNFVPHEFLPEEIKGTTFYKPGNNPKENALKNYLTQLWKNKYNF